MGLGKAHLKSWEDHQCAKKWTVLSWGMAKVGMSWGGKHDRSGWEEKLHNFTK